MTKKPLPVGDSVYLFRATLRLRIHDGQRLMAFADLLHNVIEHLSLLSDLGIVKTRTTDFRRYRRASMRLMGFNGPRPLDLGDHREPLGHRCGLCHNAARHLVVGPAVEFATIVVL